MSFGITRLKKPGMRACDGLVLLSEYPQVQQSLFLSSSVNDPYPDTYMSCVQCSAFGALCCDDQDKEKQELS
ncbi:hypothetical protein U370_04610 [Anaplasma marginale str. Dawn]|uniref:hypothetical protein n=1 Tax=Anaplasma marginale TaxID=770 RepID=UPI0003C29872|nr:hypothetical protein [Anaplasma marginale]AGZ80007.1 hypothetical protein U370_04610 [Anaplasma marginale str. Dawn]